MRFYLWLAITARPGVNRVFIPLRACAYCRRPPSGNAALYGMIVRRVDITLEKNRSWLVFVFIRYTYIAGAYRICERKIFSFFSCNRAALVRVVWMKLLKNSSFVSETISCLYVYYIITSNIYTYILYIF